MGEYTVKLAGTSRRQSAIRDLDLFAAADLVPEDDNRHDPNAVRVDVDGEPIGYVPAESWLQSAARTTDVHAEVAEILGGTAGKKTLGVVLVVYTAKDAAKAREAAANRPAQSAGCLGLVAALAIVALPLFSQ